MDLNKLYMQKIASQYGLDRGLNKQAFKWDELGRDVAGLPAQAWNWAKEKGAEAYNWGKDKVAAGVDWIGKNPGTAAAGAGVAALSGGAAYLLARLIHGDNLTTGGAIKATLLGMLTGGLGFAGGKAIYDKYKEA